MAGALTGKTIILGITGSIAAYKSADLIRLLVESGASVHPVLTRAGAEFITPMTLQTLARNPVGHDLWAEGDGWNPGHIELADKADLLLVAPATAHCIAQFAHGLAADLLTSLHLATLAPVMIAPAMNGKMWQHWQLLPMSRRCASAGFILSSQSRVCWPAATRAVASWHRSKRLPMPR